MSESLQDQLRALGLAKKADNRKRRRGPAQSSAAKPAKGKKKAPGGEIPLDKAWKLRDREEHQAAERKRRQKQEEERKRREINRQIKAVIQAKRLNAENAETARHFMFRDRIRKVYVTPEQNRALSEGTMGLAYLSGGYHLLDAAALEAVRAIAADHVVDLAGGDEDEDEFPVPDDITW